MSVTNFLYNPERKGKQQLIAEFVIRQPILEAIMQDLETSPMNTPEQHYLLVGPRGTGKTTLLNRIRYAVEDSPKLKSWLIPVIFSEEQYNIGELANLWESVAQSLEDYHGFEGIYAEMEKYVSDSDFEERCRDILEAQLNNRGKKLVLLIDNIGDLLKKIGEMEVRRLRMILQTKPYIRLIAGSPLYLESLLDYKQPLFEFFKVIRLEGLGEKETSELLLKLGEIYNEKEKIERIVKESPERIETLRVLTGGVPRTIALMFNIFIEYEHENSLKDLERILDAVTPLYKHRMDDLPTQQQKIVDAVARYWDPISVKELKDRVRLESKIISAQLRQLEKNQVIQKMETGTKNNEYILRERFFNIWYLMRYGRKDDKQRVIWLVRFLESWCTNDEIEQRIAAFVRQVKDEKINEYDVGFFGEVYSSMNELTLRSKLLLQESAPPRYGKSLYFTKEETNKVIEDSFLAGDYKKSLKWLSMVDSLEESQKMLVVDMIGKLILDKQDVQSYLTDLADKIEEELDNMVMPSPGMLQLLTMFVVVLYHGQILTNLKDDDVENALLTMRIQLSTIGGFATYLGEGNYFGDYKLEMRVILLGIKELLKHGQFNGVKKIFDEEFIVREKGRIALSEIFNPIYLALNSLESRGRTINLVPEKEDIVRKILDVITDK